MTQEDQNTPETQQDAAPQADAPKDPVQELTEKLKEQENKYLYLYAEFDTYKKRAIKERSDTLKFGWENVAREMLLVLDNLERALENAPAGLDQNFKAGVDMVEKQFRQGLEKHGVQTMTPVGQAFDPNLHEAMGQEPSETLPQGSVTRELQKGYTLHGRLLRPARVIVSMGRPQSNS